MNFHNLELTEKSQKSAQKTASLKWHAFREKVKIKKKNLKNFLIFNEFPKFRINGKYRKPASLKKRKICTFFEKTRARFPRQKERWI